ncbi:PcfJ domain-containing protein [Bradyrhizobium ontarionense]|uniref:PcfJ domain-containing protein n=1 Tax=Bradyrhizobium ontarionense TaxID=2898149 RepID=A0ABY3RLL2_9BRAD|nr:PcfJ domain-containing protein [Bradyrhizobium sp. A19]UFZ07499.1 PcfJ domain-containing protein [Bradyrhizobium sp. A19]
MAKSLIHRRQEAERARVEAYQLTLRRVARPTRPPPDLHNAIREAQAGFTADIIRAPEAWKPQLKTRDAARLRLGAARHLFARYKVAAHLEQIWIDAVGLGHDEISLRKRWYIVAASGGSLYKAGASAWLSRKEVHAFLNPLGQVGFDEAIWQAIARSYTDDPAIVTRIARSRIARTPRGELAFWREAAQFFCAQPTTGEEIDDLCDYIAHRRRRERTFSLKGRSLAALRRLMNEWHRDLAVIARIEAARRRAEMAHRTETQAAVAAAHWPGASLAEWSWSPSAKAGAKRDDYVITQLRTAEDLVAESRAMRHCVASYASRCIAGYASIWSLRHQHGTRTERLLTIELDRQHRAVQVRGFANRVAHPDERKILERWAKARGINLPEI